MKKTQNQPVVARMPAALIRLLDAAANKSRRSRSSELLFRLEQSFERDRESSKTSAKA